MVTRTNTHFTRYRLWVLGAICVSVVAVPGCSREEEPIREDAEVLQELPGPTISETDGGGGAAAAAEEAEAATPAKSQTGDERPLTTKYCPQQPHFTETSVCFILHESEGRALVQHGDPAAGIFYMEDRMGDNSEYFEIPLHIKDLEPGGYTVQPIPGEYATYVFNGEATLCATYEGDLGNKSGDAAAE